MKIKIENKKVEEYKFARPLPGDMKENKNVEEYKFARPLSEATLRNLSGYIRYSIGHGTYVIKKWSSDWFK